MVVDYEAAWHELAAVIAEKSQHGRDRLLVDMTRILDAHRVPAGELSRLLRLYGVEVERARAISAELDPDGAERFAGGLASPTDDGAPGHHDLGGHDGRSAEPADRDAAAGGAAADGPAERPARHAAA